MTCVTHQQTQGPLPELQLHNASTNQITNSGFTYDAAGNLTADGTGTGTHTYQWDAENRMTSTDTGTTSSHTINGQRATRVGTPLERASKGERRFRPHSCVVLCDVTAQISLCFRQ